MARRATIIDIAREAGMSKSIVSLVLDQSPKVKRATTEGVRQAMAGLGDVHRRAALHGRNAGKVINDPANPFLAEIVIVIEGSLRNSGSMAFLAHMAESRGRQAEVVRSMRDHGTAGLILYPSLDSRAADSEGLPGFGLPLILTIRRLAGARLPLVAADDRAGAAAVARPRAGLGHRRIALPGGTAGMAVRADRTAGLGDGLAAGQSARQPPEQPFGKARRVVLHRCGAPLVLRRTA